MNVVSFGGGTNSTAMIIGMYLHKIPIDLILFAAAAKKLEERAGVTVISPAVTPEGLKKADYMRICFAMLESADTAVFLPDWEDSPGAQLEKHWCEYVGKKMVFLMEGAE